MLGLAGGTGTLLLTTNGRFGYSGDEFYFLAAGRHADWGYADQPPLVPLLARGMQELFPDSVTALRVPSVLVTVLGVVLTAQLARELGGQRRAQLLAVGAYLSSLVIWYQGVLLSTASIATFWLTLILWLLVRWLRLGRDRLLLAAGVVTAVAVQTKLLIPVCWLAIGAAALCTGPRELFRRPRLWAGAAITALSAAPGVLWQARHDWPQLDVSAAIAAEQSAFLGGRLLYLPLVLVWAGLLTGAALACYGMWRLLRAPELRGQRFLAWSCLALLVFFWLTNGRSYYLAGFFPLLWAVAAVQLERRQPARWWRWVPRAPTFAVSALLPILLLVPVYPDSVAERNPFLRGAMGWPRFAAAVSDVYRSLPEHRRSDTAVLTQYYPHAAALEQHTDRHPLPGIHSGHRGYWYFGAPRAGTDTVIAVGFDEQYLRERFGGIRRAGTIPNPHDNLVIGEQRIWICHQPRAAWPRLWHDFRAMGWTDELTDSA